MDVRSLNNHNPPRTRARDAPGEDGSLVSAVGEDAHDEREQAACVPVENQLGALAVLDVGRVDDDVQRQSECVDEDVALAALDFLRRVIARRIARRPPFSAPLTLWLSMIAVVGLASLPARSRTCT